VQYLTTAEAAEVMRVSQASILRRINDGTLKAHNIAVPGGRIRWRITPEDLKAHVENVSSAA
jgi:excisionase family DNA binding protein